MKKKKYLFDCSFIGANDIYNSIPIYATRLIQALPSDVANESIVLISLGLEAYFKSLNPHVNLVTINYHTLLSKIPKIGVRFNKWLYNRYISNLDFDSVLIMDELRENNLFLTNKKKVAVIHDLKVIKDWKKKEEYFNYYSRLIQSCDSIIAISNYTKADVVNIFGVPQSKIKVVYNSIVLPQTSSKPNNFNLGDNYILYVNTLHPYKNVLTLVKAFNEIKDYSDLNLVLVGKATLYWEKEVLDFINKNRIGNRVFRLQNLLNEEVKYLYEHARIFVTTSLREGFGYTPIEAAICKCPVISSKCEALPDTTKNLLYYYEPAEDYVCLKNKIVEVIDNPPADKQLAEISDIFKTQYSPHKQATEILKILNEHF